MTSATGFLLASSKAPHKSSVKVFLYWYLVRYRCIPFLQQPFSYVTHAENLDQFKPKILVADIVMQHPYNAGALVVADIVENLVDFRRVAHGHFDRMRVVQAVICSK